uniref:M20 metallopeptidase family protein n=1 Tax=Thermophilibacter sp. TaxID=2847309 RepID=UPI003A949875
MDLIQRALELVDRLEGHTLENRHAIHCNPELSFKEFETSALVRSELERMGIPYELSPVEPGVIATIDSGRPGKLLMLRADMDALPIQEDTGLPFASRNEGVMHACGHDIHTAVLLGSARIFKSMENRLPGTVKLFFQPAEETVGGAKTMIDEGCMSFPDVKAVLGLHVDPTIPLGAASFLPGEM